MKKITLALTALTALTLTIALSLSAFAPTISWGVTPNKNETTPDIPAGSGALLDAHNGIFVGDTTQKQVYLTFDLGYEAGHTAAVLDTLKQHNIRAMFFLCGNYLRETELVHRMIDEGHTIGNHTNHHKDLPTLGEAAIRADIDEFTQLWNEKFGERYRNHGHPPTDPRISTLHDRPLFHFRPGKGRFDEKTLRVAKDLGLKTVMWSVAIVDWQRTPPMNPTTSAQKIASRVHPGAIILLHIANPAMPQLVEQLIPLLAEKGYTVADAAQL